MAHSSDRPTWMTDGGQLHAVAVGGAARRPGTVGVAHLRPVRPSVAVRVFRTDVGPLLVVLLHQIKPLQSKEKRHT